MADFLLRVQAADGGIPGWSGDGRLYVFDTGQVLFGWLAALQTTGSSLLQEALIRSSDWLINCQSPEGYWCKNQYGKHAKTWDARVAWSLLMVGHLLDHPAYVDAAHRCLEWGLTQQEEDGWLQNAFLEPGQPPLTHTIAYAVEALLECGCILGEGRYVLAARRTADALLEQQRADGSLSAFWAPGWRPVSRYTCLTGNAQLALCWLRLCQVTGQEHYAGAALKALNYVAQTQSLDSHWPAVKGAIAGSWPIWGRYLPWQYPNWAAKFFLDAAMLCEELTANQMEQQRVARGAAENGSGWSHPAPTERVL